MDIRRIKQVLKYGKQHAKEIAAREDVSSGWLPIYISILNCYFRYGVWSSQYKKDNLWNISKSEKKQICLHYKEQNAYRDKWVKDFFDNYRFLNKWSSFKYERSAHCQEKRKNAYKTYYGIGENCFIGYGVVFHRHHYFDSKIVTGNNCLFAEGTDIDYTGGILIGNEVSISEGVKILTHNHNIDFKKSDIHKGSVQTPLVINDKVWIGTKSLIMPGVKEIGRYAMVSAGSVVFKKVLPYSVVMGNPAKIVSFWCSPEEAYEYECTHYKEGERIPLETLQANYQKYYISRIREIKEFVK